MVGTFRVTGPKSWGSVTPPAMSGYLFRKRIRRVPRCIRQKRDSTGIPLIPGLGATVTANERTRSNVDYARRLLRECLRLKLRYRKTPKTSWEILVDVQFGKET